MNLKAYTTPYLLPACRTHVDDLREVAQASKIQWCTKFGGNTLAAAPGMECVKVLREDKDTHIAFVLETRKEANELLQALKRNALRKEVLNVARFFFMASKKQLKKESKKDDDNNDDSDASDEEEREKKDFTRTIGKAMKKGIWRELNNPAYMRIVKK